MQSQQLAQSQVAAAGLAPETDRPGQIRALTHHAIEQLNRATQHVHRLTELRDRLLGSEPTGGTVSEPKQAAPVRPDVEELAAVLEALSEANSAIEARIEALERL